MTDRKGLTISLHKISDAIIEADSYKYYQIKSVWLSTVSIAVDAIVTTCFINFRTVLSWFKRILHTRQLV